MINEFCYRNISICFSHNQLFSGASLRNFTTYLKSVSSYLRSWSIMILFSNVNAVKTTLYRRSNENFKNFKKGYTLIEVIVTLFIITFLGLIAIPTMNSIQDLQMSQGEQLILAQLDFARQQALTQNRTVQVRFILIKGHIQALQCVQVTTSGQFVPVTALQYLPSTVIIDQGGTGSVATSISTIIAGSTGTTTPTTATLNDPALPVLKNNYSYYYISFSPNGSTGLASAGTWFLTLHKLIAGDNLPITALPSNYYTIQINPFNGHINEYRP